MEIFSPIAFHIVKGAVPMRSLATTIASLWVLLVLRLQVHARVHFLWGSAIVTSSLVLPHLCFEFL